jgi:hypothetical protein
MNILTLGKKHSQFRWWRLALALLVVGCTNVVGETYGCACASRVYSIEEIAKYREDAKLGDLKAIAEMREYYSTWKADDARQKGDEKSAIRFDSIGKSYYARLLKARDPEAMEERMDELVYRAAFDAKTSNDALDALKEAKIWASLLPKNLITTDLEYDVPGRRQMNAREYINREIARHDKLVKH